MYLSFDIVAKSQTTGLLEKRVVKKLMLGIQDAYSDWFLEMKLYSSP